MNDVTGSITFSKASPDPFMSVTCAQGEHSLTSEKHRAQVVDLVLYSGLLSNMPIDLHGAGQ